MDSSNKRAAALSAAETARRAELRAMATAYQTAWDRFATKGRNGSGFTTPEQQEQIRQACGFDFTNEHRAELETLDFRAEPPERLFAYVKRDDLGRPSLVTGWTGQTLGTVVGFGARYKVGAFGRPSERQALRVLGINGRAYAGTYFVSSGDYCRLKVCRS